MALSIIEFGVYGLITYSSVLMLIISTIKETPSTKMQSIVRSIFMIPGMICSTIIASAGIDITLDTTARTNLINDTSTQIFTEIETISNTITLVNPVWVSVHYMIFLVLLVYVISQILMLFLFKD